MSTFEAVLEQQSGPVTRMLQRMLGDAELAADLRQETLAKAWRAAPREAGAEHLRRWLFATARNLALDELRRSARRPTVPLGDHAGVDGGDGGRPVRDALAALTPHERLLLLLRFEAGLSLREVGDLLSISEEAARKRVGRARAAFAEALRGLEAGESRPTVMVLLRRDDGEAYRRWLERAGARVRLVDDSRPGLDLAGADALVLSGSEDDIHPRLYGEAPSPHANGLSLDRDLRDLAALRAALASDLPVVGVCRGPQLLNVLFGGALHQHLPDAGYGEVEHRDAPHRVGMHEGSLARRVLGASTSVLSSHHQAVRRLGRGLHVGAVAPDGLPETVEVPGRRFVLGVQWHPERPGGADAQSERLAAALVEAAAA